jgi:hypothetical protein
MNKPTYLDKTKPHKIKNIGSGKYVQMARSNNPPHTTAQLQGSSSSENVVLSISELGNGGPTGPSAPTSLTGPTGRTGPTGHALTHGLTGHWHIDPSGNEHDQTSEYESTIITFLGSHKPKTNIEKLLEKVRKNCVHLCKYHNNRYHRYRRILFVIFRVPLIFLSGLNSFVAVGTQGFLAQTNISLINALVSLFCGVITSIELLINLQKRMENELDSYNKYYKLSIDIYRFIRINDAERGDVTEVEFLDDVYEKYENYIAAGNVINMYERDFLDELELYGEDVHENEEIERQRQKNAIYYQLQKQCTCCNRCFVL